ncbi:lytic transglycosylase domain-containing protein [Novosphingobium umbonatum]|nr:lytic transglycosylase domain-containing protein [Novosphingobium umbonatum]
MSSIFINSPRNCQHGPRAKRRTRGALLAGLALLSPHAADAQIIAAQPLPDMAPAAVTNPTPPPAPQLGEEWDRARALWRQTPPSPITSAIARWRQLAGTENQGYDAYASFVMAYPGFPQEEAFRRAAEKSLSLQNVDGSRLIAFFDRFPPLTNPARALYALALANAGREHQALPLAREAWRGGAMSDAAEAAIQARWGHHFTQADHDARLEALLWDGATSQASRALPRASANRRAVAEARLAIQRGTSAEVPMVGPDAMEQVAASENATEMARVTAAANPSLFKPAPATTPDGPPAPTPPPAEVIPPEFLGDPGYLADRGRMLLRRGRNGELASLFATRLPLARPALDQRRWAGITLAAARAAEASDQLHIALGAVEGFGSGTDISQLAFAVRDDYTSLMWLGGTTALWTLRNPNAAATLFYRYATAARSPNTRAKGFYWAGRAMEEAGRRAEAQAYYNSAAAYPDQFHGLMALEKLGRPLPSMADAPHPSPTPALRAAFNARPITQAVREVARETDWQTTIRFFRSIADQGRTEMDFVLLGELASELGRRDLAVVSGQAAENAGLRNFRELSFPVTPIPEGGQWTWIHAIARQESQFSYNALSRTNARGLMQLMPTTAAETARRIGLPFSTEALTADPSYNLALGNAYFARLLSSFNGSYPLAVAAYNAGPGNVRKWLAARGDPRNGGVDWLEWIERIPFGETRGYVYHVMENAVTYEALVPDKASYRGPNPLSHFLGR